MKTYLFGYGSIINLASASKTLGRELRLEDLQCVNLIGYKRYWDAKIQVFSNRLNKTIYSAFLNIEKTCNPEDLVNGVIFEINNEELEDFVRREINYRKVNVSSIIYPAIDHKSEVYTFVYPNNLRAQDGEQNTYVLERYIQIVTEGCMQWGDSYYTEFKRKTVPGN